MSLVAAGGEHLTVKRPVDLCITQARYTQLHRAWTSLCAAIMMIFAIPPLTVATLLLAADRYLGMHFFTDDLGGNMMNYVNLFWLFGHPEIYILILPALGAVPPKSFRPSRQRNCTDTSRS